MELTEGLCVFCSNTRVISESNILKRIKSLFKEPALNEEQLKLIDPLQVCPICYHKINLCRALGKDISSSGKVIEANCLLCHTSRDVVKVSKCEYFDRIAGDHSVLSKKSRPNVCTACIFYLDTKNFIKEKLIKLIDTHSKVKPKNSKFDSLILNHSTPIVEKKSRKLRKNTSFIDLTDEKTDIELTASYLKPLKRDQELKLSKTVRRDPKFMNQVLIIRLQNSSTFLEKTVDFVNDKDRPEKNKNKIITKEKRNRKVGKRRIKIIENVDSSDSDEPKKEDDKVTEKISSPIIVGKRIKIIENVDSSDSDEPKKEDDKVKDKISSPIIVSDKESEIETDNKVLKTKIGKDSEDNDKEELNEGNDEAEVEKELNKEDAPEVEEESNKEEAPEVEEELNKEDAPEVEEELNKEDAPEVEKELNKEDAPEVEEELNKGDAPEVVEEKMEVEDVAQVEDEKMDDEDVNDTESVETNNEVEEKREKGEKEVEKKLDKTNPSVKRRESFFKIKLTKKKKSKKDNIVKPLKNISKELKKELKIRLVKMDLSTKVYIKNKGDKEMFTDSDESEIVNNEVIDTDAVFDSLKSDTNNKISDTCDPPAIIVDDKNMEVAEVLEEDETGLNKKSKLQNEDDEETAEENGCATDCEIDLHLSTEALSEVDKDDNQELQKIDEEVEDPAVSNEKEGVTEGNEGDKLENGQSEDKDMQNGTNISDDEDKETSGSQLAETSIEDKDEENQEKEHNGGSVDETSQGESTEVSQPELTEDESTEGSQEESTEAHLDKSIEANQEGSAEAKELDEESEIATENGNKDSEEEFITISDLEKELDDKDESGEPIELNSTEESQKNDEVEGKRKRSESLDLSELSEPEKKKKKVTFSEDAKE